MPEDHTLEVLKSSTVAELEEIFAAGRRLSVPEGLFEGVHLARLDTEATRKPHHWMWQYLGFQALPFGVDFSACTWYFGGRRLRVGRFEPRIEPSRWREADVVALHYEVSRLPRPIRRVLYDEVVPLSGDLCLGLGGLKAERGRGDHFFFALNRAR